MTWLIALLTLTDSVIGSYLYQANYSRGIAVSVIYLKYVVFAAGFGLFIVNLARRPQLYPAELAGLAYMTIALIVSVAIARTYPGSDAVSRLYIYYVPVVIYFFGSAAAGLSTKLTLQRVTFIYAVCYIACNGLFGLQYYFFGGEALWRDSLNYAGYVSDVKGFADGVINGLPGNFYYDPYNRAIPRFIGSMGDPLAVAYSGFALFWALLWTRPRFWRTAAIIVLFMVGATLTRAVFLAAICGFAAWWSTGRNAYRLMLVACAGAVGLVLVFGDAIFAQLGDSSTGGHVDSIGQLYDFLSPASLLMGALASGDVPFFEPGFFNILFSFGVIPLVFFIIFLGGAFRRAVDDPARYGFIAVIVLGGTFTLSLMSSSFLAVTSSWFAWYCFGFASARMREPAVEARVDDPAAATA